MVKKILIQNKEIRDLFYKSIKLKRDKGQSTKSAQKIEEEEENYRKGFWAERRVRLSLRFWLPQNCILINDVVMEVSPYRFNQFDHLVIGPQGIFIIDTKTSTNKYNSFSDEEWECIKNGITFKGFKDPNKQAAMHIESFKNLLDENFAGADEVKKFVSAIIVCKNNMIEKNNDSKVANSGRNAASKVKNFVGNNLNPETINSLAKLIMDLKPLDHWSWIEKHYKIADRRTVEINGNRSQMLDVVKIYKDKGFNVSYAKEAEPGSNIWRFDVLNHRDYVEQKMQEQTNEVKLNRFSTVLRYLFPRKLVVTMIFLLSLSFLLKYNIETVSMIASKVKASYTRVEQGIQGLNNTILEESKKDENPIAMSFKVQKDITYIKVYENKKGIFGKNFKAGTEISFYKNKSIVVEEPNSEKKEYKVTSDTISFQVANDNTQIKHGEENYTKKSYFGNYSFSEDKIYFDK